ncbi:MAG: VOC family protein [Acidobacteria bacterium]|nr:MAG: VOC family protein [Acidobacteriota bacterium]
MATHRGPKYVPEGLRTLTPGLAPRGAAKMIEFLKQAFDAEEAACHKAADGTILHAKVRVGDSIIEIGEAHGEIAKPMPAVFYLYVESVDDWYRRTLRAGATSVQSPADQPYGDRVALVRDAFGNMWYIATHIMDVA